MPASWLFRSRMKHATCIDNKNREVSLVLHKKYAVIEEYNGLIKIMDESQEEYYHVARRFKIEED